MKYCFAAALLAVVFPLDVQAAEEVFSHAVRSEDFTAAGLGKLSPEELARLDALVRDYGSGALAEKAERSRAAEAKGNVELAKSPPASGGPSLLAKAKVLLTPGTQIEYATVDSRIAGEFRGWEGRTTLTLENGQRWQTAGGDSYVTLPTASPAVRIAPGAFGAFWMTIEGVHPRVKVVLVTGVR
jgi:hypothetical protein